MMRHLLRNIGGEAVVRASAAPAVGRALSSSNTTAAAADRRLAGRARFYRQVDVAPADPPAAAAADDGTDGGDGAVESPVSAGVDGTRSASGVSGAAPSDAASASAWSSLLRPRGTDPGGGWHTVTLDGRSLRTPLGLPLSLPSLPLAMAVASEWDAQGTRLRPAQMPLMTLCCTAIDQVAAGPGPARSDVLRYLRTDTSCYWADPVEDRVLARSQEAAWAGLHAAVSRGALGLPSDVAPARAVGGGEALILTRGAMSAGPDGTSGLPHPPALLDGARRWVAGLDAWNLAALYSAAAESKSFFIGAALVHEAGRGADAGGDGGGGGSAEARRDGRWAARAARVEEEFNIECWGLVEGGHDYDRLNCSVQMHSASFLAQAVADSAR